jgi:outer membrane protein TolC
MKSTRREGRIVASRTTTARVLCVLAALASAGLPQPTAAGDEAEDVVFGVVMDGPWERNEAIRLQFEREIGTLLDGPRVARFPDDKRIAGDHTRSGVRAALDELLNDPRVAMVLALGPIASYEASVRGDLFKPVFAPFILNREVQGVLQTPEGTSGVRNLNYIDVLPPPDRNVAAFLEITPASHMTFLVSRSIFDALPELPPATRELLTSSGIEIDIVPVDASAEEALARIPPETDGVYVTPLMMLAPGELDRLIEGLIERGLPSFSLWGPDEVERGMLFTLTPENHIERLARRVALNVQRVLLGEAADSFKITFALDERMLINMATARAIGIYPRWEVLTDADLINEDTDRGERTLSLISATREALESNLDLAAEGRGVLAAEGDVRAARAALLPRLDASATAVQIDDDRAAASFGSTSERTTSLGPSLRQLIYSDAANAELTIQRRLRDGRRLDFESARLDVAAEAASAFINVLRAETLLRIQRDNLRRTRSNLELARVRREIGASGPAEVFRWESEVARSRIEVIDAESLLHALQVELNSVRNAPLEQKFGVEDIGLESEDLITAGGRLELYVDNPWTFGLFRDFMVREAHRNSPELRSLDQAIAARRRALTAARRSFWAPTGVLQAEWAKRWDDGVGSDVAPPLPGIGLRDDEEWSVAINLSLPLYAGGGRSAERFRAEQQLKQLELQREAAAVRIEQSVRAQLHATGASYSAIELTREAAAAARRTLDLVTDSYSRGVVSILDLLDAQNTALVADLSAEDAVYGFILDVIAVERAIGAFYFLMIEDRRAAFFERLDEFYRARGAAPRS